MSLLYFTIDLSLRLILWSCNLFSQKQKKGQEPRHLTSQWASRFCHNDGYTYAYWF
jgi:hypothetical protein